MPCPHCAATAAAEQRKRTALGYRTFRCPQCRRTFNERTGTPFNQVQVPTDIVLLVGKCQDSVRSRSNPGKPSQKWGAARFVVPLSQAERLQ